MKARIFSKERKIEEYLDALDKIEQLRNQIRELSKRKKQYLLENSKYIFQYFDIFLHVYYLIHFLLLIFQNQYYYII